MKYVVHKLSFPWGNVAILEVPHRLPLQPLLDLGDAERYVPVSGQQRFHLSFRTFDRQVERLVYSFEPNDPAIGAMLERVEMIVVEHLLSGQAEPLGIPAQAVNLDEVLAWVQEDAPIDRIFSRPVFSDAEVELIRAGAQWHHEVHDLTAECNSLSRRLIVALDGKVRKKIRGYKSKAPVVKRLMAHRDKTVIPEIYRHYVNRPPVEQRIARVLRNLKIPQWWYETTWRQDPNGVARQALLVRAYEPLKLLSVVRDVFIPAALLTPSEFVLHLLADSVTCLPGGVLLRYISDDFTQKGRLLVAWGDRLQLVGQVKLDRRRKYTVCDALLELGVVGPHHYEGQLARAQEHPALELRRRRSFADGTVLYERRLLGATIDYVTMRGTKIGRGLGPRFALAALGRGE